MSPIRIRFHGRLDLCFSCVIAGFFAVSCGRPVGQAPDAGSELACLPSTCPGCCTAEGECLPGYQSSACGAGGNECLDCATLGGTCEAGRCEGTGPCGPQSCPGCCDYQGQCRSGALPAACGQGGQACVDCQGLACTPAGTCSAGCVDQDGDGFGEGCAAGPDCDDQAPGIHDDCAPGEPCPAGWVHIPAGPFLAGCDPEGPLECREHDIPLQEMVLDGYCIQRTEVSVGPFRPCLDSGYCGRFPQHLLDTRGRLDMPCNWGTDIDGDWLSYPMDCLDWVMARRYCTVWLGGDLPSEWQWEKAARGIDGRTYPWGEQPPECSRCNVADFCGSSHINPSWPIGSGNGTGGISPFGLKDACGNVKEYTRSSLERVGEDFDPEAGDLVVVTRGGQADISAVPPTLEDYPDFTVYNRLIIGMPSTDRSFGVMTGFRCVRPVNDATSTFSP